MYDPDFGAVAEHLPQFIGGLWRTIALGAAAVAISFPVGLGGALLRTSRHRFLRGAVAAYVQVVRNIPILLVLFVVFFQLPALGVRFDPFTAAVAALSINCTAYAIEVFRGGLLGIPVGQYDAARALGLRPRHVLAFVVLPQLMRICMPALGNLVVGITLASSVAFFIGVEELTSVSNQVGAETFRYFEVFIVAGIFYFAASQTINVLWARLGRRWSLTAQPKRRPLNV